MIRRIALALLFAMLPAVPPAIAMDSSAIPTRFPIPWGNSAGGTYIRNVPQASQIGIQNCAASLTDGFPPLTFVPAAVGGCAPFGADFNGIFKQISQWAQWQAAGAPVGWDSSFSTSIGGYPKGAIISSATFGQMWLNIAESNTTNPDAAGANWQNFYVGWTGVTAGTYVRSKVTVAADGKLTAASSGTYPTYQTLTSGSGATYTTPANVKRLKIRMIGGGGGGGGTSTGGGNGGNTSFNSIVAAGGTGGAVGASGTAVGGPGGTGGAGSATLRIGGGGGIGGSGAFLFNASGGTITFVGGAGGSGAFGGAGRTGAAAATNSGGGGGGTSLIASGPSTTSGAGAGGGSGEYVELNINNPSATYTYTVGTAGSAGTGGTAGAGAAGIIAIEEDYD